MTRPLLLDLFCGAGGAAVGYHRAGFDVIGVAAEYLAWLRRGLVYRHRQAMVRVDRLADPAPMWHEAAAERVGRHRTIYGSLDDQPAPVIAAAVTDVPYKWRRP